MRASSLSGFRRIVQDGELYRTGRTGLAVSVLSPRPTRQLQEHLILVADELDDLRAVGHELLADPEGERPGVGLWIVHGHLDLELAVVDAPEPFGECHGEAVRTSAMVEPSHAMEALGLDAVELGRVDTAEVVGFDDEGVAVPTTNRVSVRRTRHDQGVEIAGGQRQAETAGAGRRSFPPASTAR